MLRIRFNNNSALLTVSLVASVAALALTGCDLQNPDATGPRQGEVDPVLEPESTDTEDDAAESGDESPEDEGGCDSHDPEDSAEGPGKGKKGKKGKCPGKMNPEHKEVFIECREESIDLFDACVAGGGEEKECKKEAVKAFRECIDQAKADGKLPEKECPGGKCPGAGKGKGKGSKGKGKHLDPECKEQAKAVFTQCVDDGGEEKDCRVQAKDEYIECMEAKDPEFKEKSEAMKECKGQAKAHVESCLDDGNDEKTCRDEGRLVFRNCMKDNAPESELDPEKIACHKEALQEFDACLDAGGEKRECRKLRMKTFRECIKGE